MNKPVVVLPPARPVDPAGLDQLLLALGEHGAEWLKRKAARYGLTLDVWHGEDGLKRVVEDTLREHGVPNKRFGELVTPRLIAEKIGVLTGEKKRKRRLA